MKRAFATPHAPAPVGPYSQACAADGWVFLAGQVPVDARSGAVPAGISAQTELTLRNIEAILAEAGLTTADVVQTRVFLTDLDDFDEFNEVYESHFQEPYPARTTVGCVLRGFLVEIDVVAFSSQA